MNKDNLLEISSLGQEATRAQIVSIYKTYLLARSSDSRLFRGQNSLPGKLRHESLAVGDWITLDTKQTEPFPLIALHSRKNVFWRPGPSHRQNTQLLIASNIDQIFLLTSFHSPPFNMGFIDRMLLRALSQGIPMSVYVNKQDLVEHLPPEWEYLKKIGYPLYTLSLANHTGVSDLLQKLQDKTTALSGSSGVGKSTLIGLLNPEFTPDVQEVREGMGKGRHTTTRSFLYPINSTSQVIDTPGIKDISVQDLPLSNLEELFHDVHQLAEQCKFRDCKHHGEVSCAVKNAVEQKIIPEFRYLSYRKLYGEMEAGHRERMESGATKRGET